MDSSVVVRREGHVQVIAINRPEARNALDAAVARGITAAVDELDNDPELRCGVLTGTGGTFSAGMDLKAFLRGETPEIEGRGLCGITQTPPTKPLIAAVEGWALAGGIELMLAADMVVASEAARFGVPEVKRALVAGAGGAFLLTRRIPRAIALEMLLSGEPINAERAHSVGLINKVVPEGQALAVALELATTIASNGPLAVSITKAIAVSSADWTIEEGWPKQFVMLQPAIQSEDAQEGARAFAEKRSPVWTGR